MVADVGVFQAAEVPMNWYEYSIPIYFDHISISNLDRWSKLPGSYIIFLVNKQTLLA